MTQPTSNFPTEQNPLGLASIAKRSFVGIVVLGLLFLVSLRNFPVFHGIVEITSIAITWGVFLLLWNARRYLDNPSFLILGLALAFSGGIDLLHTLAYQGTNVFNQSSPSNLATQFWIAGRAMETLGWALFVLIFGRQIPVRPFALLFMGLGLWWVTAILYWENFPLCFDETTGLSTFKVVSEYIMAAVLVGALTVFHFRKFKLDRSVSRLLLLAMVMVAVAELTFTLYNDVYGLLNVLGHIFRIVSRYVLYMALIQLSVIKPYSLFFSQLQYEKGMVQESEARWRALSESSPDHILDLDDDLNIRFANYPSPGLSMSDLLGRSILDFLPPEDCDRVVATMQQALVSGEPAIYETRFMGPPGKPLYYETTVMSQKMGDLPVGGLTLVARNVTERRQRDLVLQARLRISEFALNSQIPELLQKVLDEAELLTDSTIGFFHFVNEDQVNLHLQSWSTRTLSEMCNAEGHGTHYRVDQAGVWADCIRMCKPVIHNDYAHLPDRKGMPEGHAEVLREAVIPLLRNDKVVAVLGVGNKAIEYDDSDVKLLTDLADLAWDIVVGKRAELALVESEGYLTRTMANLPGMVFRCANDKDWTFTFASQSCLDLTGYNGHELIKNRVVSYASLIHPDDTDMVTEAVSQSIAKRSAYQVTYRIIPREGPVKWVWEQGRGIFTNDQLDFLEGFIYDITLQVEAQEKQIAMERKVQEAQKLESLGVLAGGIAHDFNNLLQAMLGFAELAEDQVGPDHPALSSLEKVMESATRAADLTRQMLAFSGRGQFTTFQVDISQQVKEITNLMESSVPKSIAFFQDLSGELPLTNLDVSQFHQVVMNLITNAAEAIGDADGTIRLRTGKSWCDEEFLARSVFSGDLNTAALLPGEYVFVEVSDTGSGMESATIDRIFEPFFTTKFTGRGLGLAAVQGIIRGHKGALLVDTRLGSGTTISVYFPAACGPNQDSDEKPALVTTRPDGRKPLLLVVDDEPRVRELIAATLEREGYEVLLAKDGRHAVELFLTQSREIQGVLLDLVMPQMGGKECLAQLRRIAPEIRVVLMSGFTEMEMRERFAGQKISGMLAKPFRSQDLLEILEKAFAAR